MQISGYKRLLQINAIKQETHGSLCNLKVYSFVLKNITGYGELGCYL